MMSAREPIEEWYFRTMDGEVGLSFKGMVFLVTICRHVDGCTYNLLIFLENFHFALVGHLIKGFRHPSNATKSRTARVLTFLLSIIAKPYKRDKFEVTTESIAYLTGRFTFTKDQETRAYF